MKNNIEVFTDTLNLIRENDVLRKSLENSIKNQKIILESDVYTEKDTQTTEIQNTVKMITKKSSMNAARAFAGRGRTAVLNFASPTYAGGLVLQGASSQEECLCRVSTLYKCLTDKVPWAAFYNPHRAQKNPLNNDDLIYTPDVTVFKTDDYELLPEAAWCNVDVITCAAPNLRQKQISDDELYHIHCKRATKILSAAFVNGVKNIVLGAFGCGVFRNNPWVVAQAWKKVTDEFTEKFSFIEFAIYCGNDDRNYRVFNDVIKLV